jgi:hypothetical protein
MYSRNGVVFLLKDAYARYTVDIARYTIASEPTSHEARFVRRQFRHGFFGSVGVSFPRVNERSCQQKPAAGKATNRFRMFQISYSPCCISFRAPPNNVAAQR